MHGNNSRRVLANLDEFFHDFITGSAPVHEVEIFVVEACIYELVGVVNFGVQSDYGRYIVATEISKVPLWRVERVAVVVSRLVVRPTESYELFWYNPVEIAVFHALKQRFGLIWFNYLLHTNLVMFIFQVVK